eukprot:gene14543-biopygen8296
MAEWRKPDIICLQEVSNKTCIPAGYAIPAELTKAAKLHGMRFPSSVVIVREQLLSLVGSCSAFGSSHRGYYSRIQMATRSGNTHVISGHAPVHDAPQLTWDDFKGDVDTDISINVNDEDCILALGDWNFSPWGAPGYSCRRDETWLVEDARRLASFSESGFIGPSGEVALTRHDPRSKSWSAFDFALVRGKVWFRNPGIRFPEPEDGSHSEQN